jgi:hypothetical protein
MKRNPSALGVARSTPTFTTIAELDQSRIQHRMFAQFLRDDVEAEVTSPNYENVARSDLEEHLDTAGFNDDNENEE